MKKIFSVIFLSVIIFFCGQNKIFAADIWLYSDKNNAQYYLRECSLPARSWSFAHVIKVSGKNVTNLAYRFEMVDEIYYSVCEGSESFVFMSRESHPIIEKGTISDSPVASKIWNNHLSQMEKERWDRINASERSGRERRNSSSNETDEEIFAANFFGLQVYVLPKTITKNSKGFSVDIKFKNGDHGEGIKKFYFYNNGNINTDEKNVTYYEAGRATPGGLDNIQKLDRVTRQIYRICKKYL